MAANLHTLRRRQDGSFAPRAGILTSIQKVMDVDGNDAGVISGMVMGPRFGRFRDRAIIIPIDFTNRPETDREGMYAYRGSFLEDAEGKNPRIQGFDPAHDVEGTAYLRVQTGFDPNARGGFNAEFGHMAAALGLKPGQPFKAERHGAVVLEAGTETHQLRGLGFADEAEDAQLVWQFIGKVGSFGVPPYTDSLFRMSPKNTAVLAGNIDGAMTLVENRGGTLKVSDVREANLRPLFEAKLPSRNKLAA